MSDRKYFCAPLQGAMSYFLPYQWRRAARLPLATFHRAGGAQVFRFSFLTVSAVDGYGLALDQKPLLTRGLPTRRRICSGERRGLQNRQ